MFGLKSEELLIVLLIIVFLFGGKKIPELSRSIGEAIREIRKGLTDDVREEKTPPKAPKKED
jgi:sec-independent protein translocase protein TatA